MVAPHTQENMPHQAPSYYPTYYNSHYLQAYAQPQPQSSHSSNTACVTYVSQGNAQRSETKFFAAPSFSWYQPGGHRCTYNGCAFSGSAKSVELHMMDRHLIYPPGWDKRNKKSDWDADPSLKGKPIPIQGTSVVLDSPEVLEAWIAERKKRFPTSSRVEEKKRKMEEAVARGQLDLSEAGVRASKRRKTGNMGNGDQSKKRNQADAGRMNTFQDRLPDSGWGARFKAKRSALVSAPLVCTAAPSPAESNDDDDDEAPQVVSSRAAPPILPTPTSLLIAEVQSMTTGKDVINQKKPQPLHPKMPLRNPFAARPKLLRNLLLPEIRATVSNLSQAIRFLVDNDFLRDVEFKPGQAAEKNKIEVVQPQEDQSLAICDK